MTREKTKQKSAARKRIVLGISGASGMIYAVRFLLALPDDYQIHLIPTANAVEIMKSEIGWNLAKETFSQFAEKKLGLKAPSINIIPHHWENPFASVASGSFQTESMVIMPCSSKTLAGIACGYANNLLERAAEVSLKERRPTILIVSETPYTLVHIKNMHNVTLAGATVLPASPAFYHQPQSVNDLVDYIVAKTLDHLKIPHSLIQHWRE